MRLELKNREVLDRGLKRKINGYDCVGDNLGNSINQEIESWLKSSPNHTAGWAAWDWYGTVWHCHGLWFMRVKRFRETVGYYRGSDLLNIINEASGDFGTN